MKSIEPVYSPPGGNTEVHAELIEGSSGTCGHGVFFGQFIARPMATGLSLLIVDHQALFCNGLAAMFRVVPEVAEVAVACSSEQAVRIANLVEPDLLIINATMPGHQGFRATELIRETAPHCGILILDDAVSPAHIRLALQSGALGYWTKQATFDEIRAAVLQIGRGATAFCPAAASYLLHPKSDVRFESARSDDPLARLTPRELEVLLHLADGLSVKRCARQMKLSPSTVDNHKSRLMRKLDVHNVVELVRLAGREGLLKW